MPPYQQRVRTEREELHTRPAALSAFQLTALYKSLPTPERERLRRQARHMRGYLAVLDERIAGFAA